MEGHAHSPYSRITMRPPGAPIGRYSMYTLVLYSRGYCEAIAGFNLVTTLSIFSRIDLLHEPRMDTKIVVPVLLIFSVKGKVLAALLTKSTAEACLGEEVVFSCTVEGSSLAWSLVVTSNSNTPVLSHTFFYGDYGFASNKKRMWSQAGFKVELTLVSVEPVLVSTLAANLTDTLVGAEVMCHQAFPVNQILSGHFNLTSNC